MRLADWRQDEGLTQAELAAELGIHVQYLSQIERGVRPAGGKLALKINRRSDGKVSDGFACRNRTGCRVMASSPIVIRNRKAAAARQQLAQRRLEAKMAGAEYGSAPVSSLTLPEILERVRTAIARQVEQ